jgi:pyruvate kinase
MKHTKIVCTIGPSSESVKMLSAMLAAGMNVARLNFSHGTYENHSMLIKNIRTAAKKAKQPVAILQDLQGPKIRVSKLEQPVSITAGETVVVGKDFGMDFDVSGFVKPGHRILIEDGLLELTVQKVSKGLITCRVETTGVVKSHKGMNLPDTEITARVMTPKDVRDLQFGLEQDVDYVALSFVRDAGDVLALKKLIAKYNPKGNELPLVIAKIELPQAVRNFDEILKVSDGIMVARGDLGVEIPAGEVPVVQKNIIQKCVKAAKPVIVATQMLESMIQNPRPTRAEISDVANAVIDQTDAVMLSGESAYGKYPLEAVTQMAKAIEATERSQYVASKKHMQHETSTSEAVAEAAADLAGLTKARVIVGSTGSGFTAREIAHERPLAAKIVMFSPNPKVSRQMTLLWGVKSFMLPVVKSYDQLVSKMIAAVRTAGLVKPGQRMVLVTGEPLHKKESLDIVEVKTL